MSFRSSLVGATLGIAVVLGSLSAQAATVYSFPGSTPDQEIPGVVSTGPFLAGAGPGLLTFDLVGVRSVDGFIAGGDPRSDQFTLNLNGTDIFSAYFRLGGIGVDSVTLNPNLATFTINRTGTDPNSADFNGGTVSLSIPLDLINGANTLTGTYSTGLPQGSADEAFHVSGVTVTGSEFSAVAVPGPVAGAGLIPLFGLAGAWYARRRKRLAA